MVAEADFICHQSLVVDYLCVPSPTHKIETEFVDVSSTAAASAVPIFCSSESMDSADLTRSESPLSCSTSSRTSIVLENPSGKFVSSTRSGSHTDIGPRSYNEDQHIGIDDLSAYLGSNCTWSTPSSFYAVFDGHGGPGAACFMKENAIRFLFNDVEMPQTDDIDEKFLHDLENSQRRAFLLADEELADEQNGVDSYCGTTALTVTVVGRHLLVANMGDCRAVLCRKGYALQLSEDHRPSCQVERRRVEDLGGTIKHGYLNGELAVTRALGDWYLKQPLGSTCPLISEPEFQQARLTDDDEFLIIACDGVWDVLSNQEAVKLVRRELRHHNDPQKCAEELIHHASKRDSCDNLTAMVICFSSSSSRKNATPSQRSRLRFCISDEARKKLCRLLEGA